MALVVAIIVGFTVLESPWRWVAIAAGAVIEVGEAAAMVWWSRRGRPRTGAHALLGRHGVTIAACRPHGQVRVDGEIWAAVCPDGADGGTAIVVSGVDGLELTVTPRPEA